MISIFNHWELGGESSGYWFFSKILLDKGGFLVLERSPLYTIYLLLFQWLDYPNSIIIEYILTTLISSYSIMLLVKFLTNSNIGILSGILWIFLLQGSEPPVNKLALAFSIFALIVRLNKSTRFNLTSSYALFIVSYLFRQNYILLVLTVFIVDLGHSYYKYGLIELCKKLKIQKEDWPLILVFSVITIFIIFQSNHPWNNIYFGNQKWIAGGDVSNFTEMVIHLFSINEILQNIKLLFYTIINITVIPLPFKFWWVSVLICAYILYFILSSFSQIIIKSYIIGLSLVLMSTIFIQIVSRYMTPSIPIFILFAICMSNYIQLNLINIKSKKLFLTFLCVLIISSILFLVINIHNYKIHNIHIIKIILMYFLLLSFMLTLIVSFSKYKYYSNRTIKNILLVIFFCFTGGLQDWVNFSITLANDLRTNEIKIFENRTDGIKSIFTKLNMHLNNCDILISGTSTYIGAFSSFPRSKIYDFTEIPNPSQGSYNQVYPELETNSIVCIYITNKFATHQNAKHIRKYLKSYINSLKNQNISILDFVNGSKLYIIKKQ